MKTIEEEALELQEKYGKKDNHYGLGIYAGIKKGFEIAHKWITIERDKDGFTTENQCDLFIENSPFLVKKSNGEIELFIDDMSGEIERSVEYEEWRPIQRS